MKKNKFLRMVNIISYESMPLFILIIIIILFSILTPFFYKFNNIRNILLDTTVNGTMAIGATYVMISGGLDLSIGSVMAFSTAVGVSVLNYSKSVTLAIIASLSVGIFLGLINGILVTKGKINPFIATLGTFITVNGLLLFYTKNLTIHADVFKYSYISDGRLFFLNFPIWIFVIFLIMAHIFISRSAFGKHLFAIGGNEDVCKLMGISIDRNKLFIYMFSGFCAALAGIFLSSRAQSAAPTFGELTMFQVLGAVILGGVSLRGGEGKVYNSAIGVIIFVILANAFGLLNVHSYLQLYVWGGLLIIVTIIDNYRHRSLIIS